MKKAMIFTTLILAVVMTGCGSAPRKMASMQNEKFTMTPVEAATAVAETEAETEAVTEAATEAETSMQSTSRPSTTADAVSTTAVTSQSTAKPTTTAATTAKPAASTTTTTSLSKQQAEADAAVQSVIAAQQKAEQDALAYVGAGYSVVSMDMIPSTSMEPEFKVGVAPVSDRNAVLYLCAGDSYCITEEEWNGCSYTKTAQFFADKRMAENTVRSTVGAAVLTSEALPTNDNTNCFKITTAAGTYYVGKNFCMTEAEWLAPAAPVSTGMIAGFTGRYTNGRAQMEIAAKDNGTASVIVSWAGSAFDTTVWTMSGTVSTVGDNLVITYSDCTKETTSYTADGTLNQDLIEYMNGTGTICIDTNDSTVVWADAQENAADGEIFFRPVA